VTGADRGQPLVLAVDLGSGGLKVGFTTLTGSPVWWSHERLVTQHGPDGAVTQDAEGWWTAIVRLARRGLADPDIDGNRVVGVAVTGQWGSTVPVDDRGHPVADVVMWDDARGVAHSRAVVGGPIAGYSPRALATWLRRSGGVPNPTGQDPLAHLLHLARDRADVHAAARWYLEPVDYLVMRFTGVASATPMSMTGAWLTDNRDLQRVAYDDTLVRLAGVDRHRLPPLAPSGTIVGTVLPEVADDLGIPRSARVVTGAQDLHVAVVGSGCVEPFQAHVSIGTTGWISCPVPYKRTDVLNQIASVPGIGDGRYILANDQDNAGRCLDWFRRAVSVGGRVPSHEELLAHAATAPAGSGGVLFTPWLSGERSTLDDRNARGGFHNVGLGAGSAELTRAVLEGVAFNTRMLLGASERFVRRRLEPLRIVGGGARSDLWCQIVADVCDRRIERVAEPMVAGLRGAGLFLALALGEVSAGEIRSLVPVDRVFVPDPATRATYERLYAEFPRLHKRNKGMFVRLNA
jgi:xylulokinase